MAVHLNQREKYAVILGAGILCLFVLIEFAVSPLLQKRADLKRVMGIMTNRLPNMYANYDILKTERHTSKTALPKRAKNFTLFSFLDQLVRKAGIKENLKYMKPSTTVEKSGRYKISLVEMKLQALTLEQLTKYLYMVETSRNDVTVKRLSISKTGKPEGFINAVLQVETLET